MFTLEAISSELRDWDPPSPALVIDLARVTRAFERLSSALPDASIHYAVKCNPTPELLSHLLDLGCQFEIASVAEMYRLLRIGADPGSVFFSAPVKSTADIELAYQLGVRTFAVDCQSELEKLLSCAPDAAVHVRLAVDDHDSRWPLSGKFGASEYEAIQLVAGAAAGGLVVGGLSFHVGSQASTVDAWRRALQACRRVVERAQSDGVAIRAVNMGGGFPIPYVGDEVPTVESIAAAVIEELSSFPPSTAVLCEPGRYLVAEAGDTVATVIGVSERMGRRWAFLDVGAFNGLFEGSTLGGGLRYEFRVVDRDLEVLDEFQVGGPTCDADDVLDHPVQLPTDLAVGEQIVIRSTGAYGFSYASEFCGARRPHVRCVNRARVIDLTDSVCGAVGAYRSDYQFASPGDPLFHQAKACELEVFRREGFVEPDDTGAGYDKYDSSSMFVTTEQDGEIAAVLRLIWQSEVGFKTVEDLPLNPAADELMRVIGWENIVEIGSLAAVPSARGLGPATACLRGAFHLAASRGISHFVTSLDAGLLEHYRSGLQQRYVELGETQFYYGSRTTPVLLNLAEWADGLGESRRDLYSLILQRRLIGVGEERSRAGTPEQVPSEQPVGPGISSVVALH